MDKRNCLFVNSATFDPRLTRASSFSDLSTMKKVTPEVQRISDTCGSLVKQNSCEDIFNRQKNKSHHALSQQLQFLKPNVQEPVDISRKKEIPTYNIKTFCWSKKSHLQKNASLPIEQQLSLINMNNSNSSRKILAPSKLIIEECDLNKSISNSQSSQYSLTRSSSSNLSRYQSCDDSIALKRLITFIPNRQSITSKELCIVKSEKIDDCNISDINRKDYPKLTKTDFGIKKENEKRNVRKLNKRLKSLIEPAEASTKSFKQSRSWIYWTFLMILFPTFIFYLGIALSDTHILNKLCDPQLKINAIPEELSKFVYGQDSAIKIITKFFIKMEKKTTFNILVLIGGIGVGKSYTSEIIRRNLKESTNVIDFYSPLYTKETRAYSLLSACKCNLIRLENLKIDDIAEMVHLSSYIKEKAINNCVMILAIFNPEETDKNLKKVLDLNKSSELIENEFREAKLKPTIVNYIPLSYEALNKCIQSLANYIEIELLDNDYKNIMEDLKIAESGCKGAYAKIQIAGRNIRKSLPDH